MYSALPSGEQGMCRPWYWLATEVEHGVELDLRDHVRVNAGDGRAVTDAAGRDCQKRRDGHRNRRQAPHLMPVSKKRLIFSQCPTRTCTACGLGSFVMPIFTVERTV